MCDASLGRIRQRVNAATTTHQATRRARAPHESRGTYVRPHPTNGPPRDTRRHHGFRPPPTPRTKSPRTAPRTGAGACSLLPPRAGRATRRARAHVARRLDVSLASRYPRPPHATQGVKERDAARPPARRHVNARRPYQSAGGGVRARAGAPRGGGGGWVGVTVANLESANRESGGESGPSIHPSQSRLASRDGFALSPPRPRWAPPSGCSYRFPDTGDRRCSAMRRCRLGLID